MIEYPTFRKMLEQLLAKSKKDEVLWRMGETGEGRCFYVVFPSSAKIEVTVGSPDSRPDWASARLTKDDEVLFRIQVDDSDELFPLLNALCDDAYRAITGWDQIVAEIEEQLSTEGRIGVPPPEPSGLSSPDTLPF